ncbi:MAG: recombinase XerC [Clostridiales bacterium 43-6]|nr:MAG: recombinase XerC [Clostridiales bacterium 43-6]
MDHKEIFLSAPLIKEFLTYTESIKGKSKKTVEEYFLDLRTFFRFLKQNYGLVPSSAVFEEIDISDIDIDFIKRISLEDAYSFLVYCKNERDNNEKTRARKTSSLKSFFKYITNKKGLLHINPLQELDSPKAKKSLPKYLTLEQSMNLLNAVEGKNSERDYAILTLFLNCGLRLSEVCSLNLGDIRSDNTMRVTGKGNKERIVYLNDACLDAIKKYLIVRKVDGVKDRDALFLSSRLSRISNKTIQYIVYTYLEKAGLGNMGYSVHKLRHTAATLMYQHGNVDIRVLKDILGHENLGTTEIYTHLSSKQLQDASGKNPLSKIRKK